MRILVIGLGRAAWAYAQSNPSLQGITHSYALRAIRPTAKFVGVDPSELARLGWSKEFKAQTYKSLQSVGDLEIFDLIVVATPAEQLCQELIWILNRNAKATIVVEKPLAVNSTHIASLEVIPENSKKRIFVNFPRLFQPETHIMKQIIQSDFWQSRLELNVNFSGGFYNTGSHFLSLFSYLFDNFQLHETVNTNELGILAHSAEKSDYQLQGTLKFEEFGQSTGSFSLVGIERELNYLNGGNEISGRILGREFNVKTTRANYQSQVYLSLLAGGSNFGLHPSRLDQVLPALKTMVEIGNKVNARI